MPVPRRFPQTSGLFNGNVGDWEEAVKAGSTWLRLGSIIFGNRTY